MEVKSIALPRLNGLNPTLESTALKLMEEAGELAQAIGKFRGMSGETRSMSDVEAIEAISKELLDVAQTAVSMMFVLEETFQVRVEDEVQKHYAKLMTKGYILPEHSS
ncbi:MAG: MazG-like family protein [Methylocystaceae bacterium]